MSTPAATTSAARRGLWRWFVALVATVLLVVSGSGLVVFAANGEAEAKGPQFVSDGAPVYIEARLDMPGGQRDAVAEMLTAFPLFGDANSFDMKVDEALDSLLEGATGGALAFSGEIEDIITGELGVAITDIESALMGGGDPAFVVGIAHNDAAAAQSFIDLMSVGAAESGDLIEETYGDTTILVDPQMAVAVTEEWVLLSQSVEEVQKAIDVLAGTIPSLADAADFQTAFGRLPSPRLGAAWVDYASLGSLLELGGMMAAGQAGVSLPTADLMELLPLNLAAALSAEADRLHLDSFLTTSGDTPAAIVGESDLATLFPADTQIYGEWRGFGAALEMALEEVGELLAAQAEGASVQGTDLAQIELLFSEESPITSMLGASLPQYFGFLGDTAVGAGLTSDGVSLGIASEVADQELAEQRVERLISILRLAGASDDAAIAIDTVMIDGTEATAVTLPADAIAGAGLPVPIDNTVTVAVSDGYVLLGLGDFVETALTLDAADSLAASPGYTDALAGDTPNSGVLYADVASVLAALDPMLSMMAPQWADVQPFATGIDRFIAVGTADEEIVEARMTVIVAQ